MKFERSKTVFENVMIDVDDKGHIKYDKIKYYDVFRSFLYEYKDCLIDTKDNDLIYTYVKKYDITNILTMLNNYLNKIYYIYGKDKPTLFHMDNYILKEKKFFKFEILLKQEDLKYYREFCFNFNNIFITIELPDSEHFKFDKNLKNFTEELIYYTNKLHFNRLRLLGGNTVIKYIDETECHLYLYSLDYKKNCNYNYIDTVFFIDECGECYYITSDENLFNNSDLKKELVKDGVNYFNYVLKE